MVTGRPPVFSTPDDLDRAFNNYIQHCIDNKIIMPNIAGFCFFSKINQDTYYEYKNNKKEFSESIKRFELFLEDNALNSKDTIKSIFYLKNKFGYADKQEIQQTNTNIDIQADDDFLDTIRKKYLASST